MADKFILGFPISEKTALSELYQDGSDIGIGTDSPNERLHLHESTSGTNYIQITNSATGTASTDGMLVGLSNIEEATIWQFENKDMRFGTNNTERMRIDSEGAITVKNDFIIDNSSPEIYLQTGATHYRWMLAAQENVDGAFEITPSTAVGGSTYSSPVAVFKATGNVGIGTTSPKADSKLTVALDTTGGSLPTDKLMVVVDDKDMALGNGGGIKFGGVFTTGGSANGDLAFIKSYKENATSGNYSYALTFGTRANGGNPTEKMRISSNGDIGVPTDTDVIYDASSDRRVKKNINTIESGIETLKKLNPVTFEWEKDHKPEQEGNTIYGFIAQELQEAIPEAVFNTGNSSEINGELVEDILNIKRDYILPVLVKALQEANERIEYLESKIK